MEITKILDNLDLVENENEINQKHLQEGVKRQKCKKDDTHTKRSYMIRNNQIEQLYKLKSQMVFVDLGDIVSASINLYYLYKTGKLSDSLDSKTLEEIKNVSNKIENQIMLEKNNQA